MNTPYIKKYDKDGKLIPTAGTYMHFAPNRAARRKQEKEAAKIESRGITSKYLDDIREDNEKQYKKAVDEISEMLNVKTGGK